MVCCVSKSTGFVPAVLLMLGCFAVAAANVLTDQEPCLAPGAELGSGDDILLQSILNSRKDGVLDQVDLLIS